MKRLALLILLLFSGLFLSSCKNESYADIVTTMYVQYDFTKQIVKNKLDVKLLIPPGSEIHDYDVTINDMVSIKESKLFIFTSLELNTWVEDPDTIGGDETIVLDLSSAYTVMEHEHHDEVIYTSNLEVEDEHDHDHAATVHYWTDPTTAIQLIDAILEKVILIDPDNADFYTENANAYKAEIMDVHELIEALIESVSEPTIYFAGHNALGAFAERYGLHIISLFEAFKPDADLSIDEIVSLTNQIREAGASYLFIEELAEPKAAEKIVDELSKYNITLLELHGYHNITEQEFKDGVTYVDLMNRNLDHLQTALIGDDM